jgi:hypothetical protein
MYNPERLAATNKSKLSSDNNPLTWSLEPTNNG